MQTLALALFTALLAGLAPALAAANPGDPSYVRLTPLPAPKVAGSATPYPGGAYEPRNLLDGNPRTEYSSDGKGTNTYLEFDFGTPTRLAGFRHLDRNDPATVSASEFLFLDAGGQPVGARLAVTHVNKRAGITWFAFPSPVTAQRVRWRITGLGPQNYGTVGGAEMAFYTAGAAEASPRGLSLEVQQLPMLERKGAELVQPLQFSLDYPYASPVEAVLRVEGQDAKPVSLKLGTHKVEAAVPAVSASQPLRISVEALGQNLASRTLTLKPARQLDIYLLPHSHVDIGYTALAGRRGEEAEQQHRDRPAARQSHRRLPRRLPLQVERRGALVRGQLPARGHAGEARRLPGRGQVRPDRSGRLLLQHSRPASAVRRSCST